MTDDATLIAALRKCEHCESSGKFRGLACGWCRLARMAADRIERLRSELEKANNEFGCQTADWPNLWQRIAEIKEQSGRYWREIERMRAGGCTRDQRTTQFYAEAQALSEEVEQLRDWQRNVLETSAAAEIAKRVRERCARECVAISKGYYAHAVAPFEKCADAIRALTVEELLP